MSVDIVLQVLPIVVAILAFLLSLSLWVWRQQRATQQEAYLVLGH